MADGTEQWAKNARLNGKGIASALCLLLACVLVACGPGGKDRVVARLVGDVVEFQVCSPIAYNRVVIEVRGADEAPASADTAWVIEGPAPSDTSRLTYGVLPQGMTSTSGAVGLNLDDSKLQIEFQRIVDGTVEDARMAAFTTSELSTDKWLTGRGVLVDKPCE